MVKRAKRTHFPLQAQPAGAVSHVLQGRDRDLAMVDRTIARIDQGGSTLVISGEPGIGKSALLEQARYRARERDLTVLRMTGVLAEVHLPYAALEQALRPLMKEAVSLVPRQRSALLAAFGMQDDTGSPDIFLVALATLSLLTESAARKPILLIADDAQWLDEATYEVLAFISRRLSSDPVLLFVAMRDGFDRLFDDASNLRLRLSGLSDTDSERLLDANAPDLPADLRSRFLKEASGNPLALLELPRDRRAADIRDTIWLPLTERLERAFSARVADLPAATQMLLFVAAENDRTSLYEILRAGKAVLGGDVDVGGLTPAIAAGLIDVDETDVRFQHPLVRSAMHQAADLATRQKIHAALAVIVHEELDRHLWHRAAATIGPDDELADRYDAMAGRALRKGAVAMAIEILEKAAALSSKARARSDRFLRAAELAAELGQPQLLERLLRQANMDEPSLHMRARLAWVREISQPLTINDVGRISALIGFAADAHAHGDRDLALGLLWRAAQRCWWGSMSETVCASVHAAARKLSLPATNARLIAIEGYVGTLEHGYDVYRRLAAHAAAGVPDPVTAWILGLAGNTVGAYDFSIIWLTDASTAFREQGRLSDLARVLFSRSCAEAEMGDWTGALRSSAESARFGEETGQTVWVAASAIVQAILAGRRGHFDAAEAQARQAERLLLSPGTNFWRALLQNARGIIALGADRHAEAYEHLQRMLTPGDPAFNASMQFYCLGDYVEAALACGQEAVAAAAVEIVERRSGPVAAPWVRMIVSYCKALLAAPDRAEKCFQDAFVTDVQTWPFRHGCCLLAYGTWLRRQRRIADARAPLRAARDIFDALGAGPWSERARRELRAAGEVSRPRQGRMLDELTPQELQIAELAASGLSNKEIGARLYLSHRTVGYHLYRIFPKLGITTRSGLHAALNQALQPTG
jgi:DNA-binding CsgD family transcriptional regulator